MGTAPNSYPVHCIQCSTATAAADAAAATSTKTLNAKEPLQLRQF